MNYRILSLAILVVVAPAWTSTCFGGSPSRFTPTSGVYVYGPPTVGHSTPVFPYPKSWRGPRYAYPETYYFKFPPGRRPVQFSRRGLSVDPTFFSGATTNAEIWVVRRKGEVDNLPDSARFPQTSGRGIVPVIGPLPKRAYSSSFSQSYPKAP
jgi:hypothetical protein